MVLPQSWVKPPRKKDWLSFIQWLQKMKSTVPGSLNVQMRGFVEKAGNNRHLSWTCKFI